jgi:hypothetical protein
MAKRIAIRTERVMVSPEALKRNVDMHWRALDLLKEEHPGFAIQVSAARNADLALKEHVAVRNTGTIVSVAAGPEIKKPDAEMSAFYLVVAKVCAKTEQLWYERELEIDEYEGKETDRVAIIVGQSSSAHAAHTVTTTDKDIDLSREMQGVSGNGGSTLVLVYGIARD